MEVIKDDGKKYSIESETLTAHIVLVREYYGDSFRTGKRYGDLFSARYYIDFVNGVPVFRKDKKFKPYRATGWGSIDWEAVETRKALNLDREPTEDEIKRYCELKQGRKL